MWTLECDLRRVWDLSKRVWDRSKWVWTLSQSKPRSIWDRVQVAQILMWMSSNSVFGSFVTLLTWHCHSMPCSEANTVTLWRTHIPSFCRVNRTYRKLNSDFKFRFRFRLYRQTGFCVIQTTKLHNTAASPRIMIYFFVHWCIPHALDLL